MHFQNYEESCTITSQIESILNSRPFLSLSADRLGLSIITLDHILIGSPLRGILESDQIPLQTNRLSHLQLLEKLEQRWSKEYIHLRQRNIWCTTAFESQSTAFASITKLFHREVLLFTYDMKILSKIPKGIQSIIQMLQASQGFFGISASHLTLNLYQLFCLKSNTRGQNHHRFFIFFLHLRNCLEFLFL